jgi:hypothetical protein
VLLCSSNLSVQFIFITSILKHIRRFKAFIMEMLFASLYNAKLLYNFFHKTDLKPLLIYISNSTTFALQNIYVHLHSAIKHEDISQYMNGYSLRFICYLLVSRFKSYTIWKMICRFAVQLFGQLHVGLDKNAENTPLIFTQSSFVKFAL